MLTNEQVKNVKTDLLKAKNVLVKNKWIKGSFATKANGHTDCNATSKEAKCFCALGALQRVTNDSRYFNACKVLRKAVESLTNDSDMNVPLYNDSVVKSKKEILALFDYAVNNVKSLIS